MADFRRRATGTRRAPSTDTTALIAWGDFRRRCWSSFATRLAHMLISSAFGSCASAMPRPLHNETSPGCATAGSAGDFAYDLLTYSGLSWPRSGRLARRCSSCAGFIRGGGHEDDARALICRCQRGDSDDSMRAFPRHGDVSMPRAHDTLRRFRDGPRDAMAGTILIDVPDDYVAAFASAADFSAAPASAGGVMAGTGHFSARLTPIARFRDACRCLLPMTSLRRLLILLRGGDTRWRGTAAGRRRFRPQDAATPDSIHERFICATPDTLFSASSMAGLRSSMRTDFYYAAGNAPASISIDAYISFGGHAADFAGSLMPLIFPAEAATGSSR